MQEIIDRNFIATNLRGLITKDTSMIEFIDKIKEEVQELEEAVEIMKSANNLKPKHFQDIEYELADVILTCFSTARKFDIDIEKVLLDKTIINEARALKIKR